MIGWTVSHDLYRGLWLAETPKFKFYRQKVMPNSPSLPTILYNKMNYVKIRRPDKYGTVYVYRVDCKSNTPRMLDAVTNRRRARTKLRSESHGHNENLEDTKQLIQVSKQNKLQQSNQWVYVELHLVRLTIWGRLWARSEQWQINWIIHTE
jgi:hypothetical protein